MELTDELGYWYPAHVLPSLPEQLPIPLPTDSWVRVLPDPDAELPMVRVQLAWVTAPVLHLVTAGGFTLDASAENAPGGDAPAGDTPAEDTDDEVRILAHERISLETIQRLNLDVETGSATAEFSDRAELPDAPGLLLNQYLR